MTSHQSHAASLWPYPRFVVHRAGGTLAPENTSVAFEIALQYGCRAVEVDVMMTQDRHLVLSHDEHLGRAVDGSGSVAQHSLKALLQLDAAVGFPQYRGLKMMTLEDALAFAYEADLMMNLEIKPAAGFEEETAALLAQTLKTHPLAVTRQEKFLVSSFSTQALEVFGSECQECARGLLLETIPNDWLETAIRLAVRTVHPDHVTVAPEFVHQAHDARLGIMAYTVDDVSEVEKLLEMGVDAVCTNRPDIMTQSQIFG